MNNAVTLVPSDQIIVAYSDGEITAGEISRALFYANSRLLAMRLYIDKSFSTAMPGYAENFYTLMQWEMEVSIQLSGCPVVRSTRQFLSCTQIMSPVI